MEDDEDEEEEEDDDEDEEIPLDMEEIEAASKKARQEEELHSEHIQVLTVFKSITYSRTTYCCCKLSYHTYVKNHWHFRFWKG